MQVVDWQTIIEKHGASVWQTSYRLLGNSEDAADCFQETFTSALEFCRRKRVRNFPALLTQLATARAIDQLRRRFRREQKNVETENNKICADCDPAKYAQQRELAIELRKALAQLPPQEAQVFCLRHLNNMSYRQIAKELGIKTNAAGVLLHRAKEKLKKAFEASSKNQSEVLL